MTLESWVLLGLSATQELAPVPESSVLRGRLLRDIGHPFHTRTSTPPCTRLDSRSCRRSGNAIFSGARDTVEKRRYFRQKYLAADDTVVHPLTP